jgi:hypothetical protein
LARLAQAFPWEKYDQIDLLELITSEDAYAKENDIPLENRYSIMPAVRYTSVVEYEGQKRDIPANHKQHLSDVVKAAPSIPQAQIDTYTSEILLKVRGKEIWALIQGPVLPYLEREIKPGDKLQIYYFYFGAYQKDHIVAINEFQAKSSE